MLSRSWVAVLTLALVVASDYDLRVRAPSEALSGSTDAAIIAEVLTYGLVAGFLAVAIAEPPRWRWPGRLVVALWAWALVSAMSATYSPFGAIAQVRGAQLLITAGLATAVAHHAERRQLHVLTHAYVVLTTASVAVGLAHPFPRIDRQANRFTWLYVHPVTAGTMLGIAVVILTAYLVRERRDLRSWPPTVYVVLLGINLAGLLATITRAAIAATACACVALLAVRSDVKRRVDLAVFSVVGVALVGLLFASPIIEYVLRGQSVADFQTLSARTTLWQQAWELLVARPVLGYGLMAGRGVFLDETGLGSAHNAVIEVAVNSGLVGVATWVIVIAMTAWMLQRSWRPGRDVDVPLLTGLLVFLMVNGLSTEGPGNPANVQSIMLFVVVGWAAAASRWSSTTASPPLRSRLRPR